LRRRKKRMPSDIDMRRILLIAGEKEVWRSGEEVKRELKNEGMTLKPR